MKKIPGIVKYNKIRHELSVLRKEKNIQFEKGVFNDLSRDIFRGTREKDVVEIKRDLDKFIVDQIRGQEVDGAYIKDPEIREEFTAEAFPYFELAVEVDMLKGREERKTLPTNLMVVSANIIGHEIQMNKLDYGLHIQRFVGWCDANRDHNKEDPENFAFGGSDDVPYVVFTQPWFNPKRMRYQTELIMAGPDLLQEDYGFRPDYEPEYMPPEMIEQGKVDIPLVTLSEMRDEIMPAVPEIEKPPAVPEVPMTGREKIEYEKAKAETLKEARLYAKEKSNLIKLYRKDLSDGLISKDEYRTLVLGLA